MAGAGADSGGAGVAGAGVATERGGVTGCDEDGDAEQVTGLGAVCHFGPSVRPARPLRLVRRCCIGFAMSSTARVIKLTCLSFFVLVNIKNNVCFANDFTSHE